jgi:hypothetical protein
MFLLGIYVAALEKYQLHPAEYDYRKIYGERVYHMNMIIKYSMKNIALYKRFRIVLNQDGIKRIENVVSDEEHTS